METTGNSNINHAVRYDGFGHAEVLYIAELLKPAPKAGEVLVKIKTAGINPGEASIREGRLKEQFPSTFPSGQGSDFAGMVEAAGEGVTEFKAGDEVFGFTDERNSQAEYIVVKAEQLFLKPANLSWEIAGGLSVVGATAWAAVNAVNVKQGDTVIVSGAAGGVGTLAVQIAKHKGACIIGLASPPHHQWLTDHGIEPLVYEGNTEENINTALKGSKADAFIDTSGKGYVEMAVNMGIPAERINTIIDFAAAGKYKVKTDGGTAVSKAEVLPELGAMLSDGRLEMPIAATFPLEQVREAFDYLQNGHTLGKIVLTVSSK